MKMGGGKLSENDLESERELTFKINNIDKQKHKKSTKKLFQARFPVF